MPETSLCLGIITWSINKNLWFCTKDSHQIALEKTGFLIGIKILVMVGTKQLCYLTCLAMFLIIEVQKKRDWFSA